MTATVFISTTSHMVVIGICNSLLPRLIPCPQRAPQMVMVLYLAVGVGGGGAVTLTFTPEESRPLVILPELGCNFPLTLITGHGTKRHPNGPPVFPKSYLHCTVAA